MALKIKKRKKGQKTNLSKKEKKKLDKAKKKAKQSLNVRHNEFARMDLEAKAVELRVRGYTYPMISEQTGKAISWCWKAVQRAIDKYSKKYPEAVERLRQIDLQRTDKIIREAEVLLRSPDPMNKSIGADKMMKAMELRAKYIPKLHVPKVMQLGLEDELKEEMSRVDEKVVSILKRLAGEGEEDNGDTKEG